MLRKGLVAAVFTAGLFVTGLSAADIRVNIAPPRVHVEHRSHRPGPEYVWTPGYYRWDGHAYAWSDGSWQRPPHRHARWVTPRWRRDGRDYVFVEGRWR